MCRYCEPIDHVNFCESIAETGFENVAIIYQNDVAYFGLSGDEFVTSEPISFCPFCGKNLAFERNIEEDPDPVYKMIDESDVKVGDYVCIDGESSFCSFGRHIIDKILTKYDEDTGEKYLVYLDADGNKWNSKTRRCMNGLYAYDIVGFCRIMN